MNKDASGASPRIQGRIAVTETRFSTPQGDFDLERYPVARNTTLRAWDAADAFLLGHVADVLTGAVSSEITVLNDAFGALTVALSADRTVGPRNQVNFVSDSHLAWLAMLGNLARNGMAKPSEPEPGGPDLVLVKIPKTLALLETQLVQLRQAITPKTVIVGGGMTRRAFLDPRPLRANSGPDAHLAGEEEGAPDFFDARYRALTGASHADTGRAGSSRRPIGELSGCVFRKAARQRDAPYARQPSRDHR